MARNSFIQMSKLSNVKGRIYYTSSKKKQENLYAVYETTERKFWKELAECNQEDFAKSGTTGKCIEARELIIALPESFVEYQPDMLLKLFTEHFKQNYGVECISALHHNKRKTNYHIHLIFSERKLLDEPIIKTASRNMFYDENGKHVRTKKEICTEDGQIRDGCHIIKKGEIYERKLFTIKDKKYKSNEFLDEVKRSYTELINLYVKDEKNKLKVFERGGVYLATKKIGKNNPKAEQIEADNRYRQRWNETVDVALVSGVPEQQILAIKKLEISDKVKRSIRQNGKNPNLFSALITMAISALQLIIRRTFDRLHGKGVMKENTGEKLFAESEYNVAEEQMNEVKQPEIPEQPKKSRLASKYPKLAETYEKLNQQNYAIQQREKQLVAVKTELENVKGVFKGKQRKELQEQIDRLELQIDNMKQYLSSIVQRAGYETVKDFMTVYKTAKVEYSDYQSARSKWEKQTGKQAEPDSIKAKLAAYQKQKKEQQNKVQNILKNDRGAR
ncbi:MAG: MobA/MobL family protein [Clostridiales bacterium]|nr:MobA/MobL family protein [Clostridiales bacterium]